LWSVTVADKHNTVDKEEEPRLELSFANVDIKVAKGFIMANEARPWFDDVASMEDEEDEGDSCAGSEVEDEWVVI